MSNNDADQLFAFLNGNAIDPSLGSPAATTTNDSTLRPVNFSSAFSQSSRSQHTPSLSQPNFTTSSYANPISANDFQDFGFLDDDLGSAGGGGAAIAGPGPNSIAAAVGRSGYSGLEHFELPIVPDQDEEPFVVPPSKPRTKKQARNEAEADRNNPQAAGRVDEAIPAPKKRGRPRTRPLKDPNEPPKKRGRPRKNPDPLPVPPPLPNPAPPRSASEHSVPPRHPDLFPLHGESGGSDSESGPSGSDSGRSTRSGSQSESGSGTEGDGKKERKKKKSSKRRKKKLADPPLIPRIFRSAKKLREEKEVDLDVNDLGKGDVDLEAVPELTEEQKRELQRAMNPTFSTRLLTALGEHSEYYERAYKALHEELLAVQVEESLLEHVKDIALEMRNSIRYPLKTIEEIEQLEAAEAGGGTVTGL